MGKKGFSELSTKIYVFHKSSKTFDIKIRLLNANTRVTIFSQHPLKNNI